MVFSGASDTASITVALDLGAMGFIPKTSPRAVLVNAVRLVVSGGVYVSPEVLKSAAADPQAPAAHMTLPNKLIARRLQI